MDTKTRELALEILRQANPIDPHYPMTMKEAVIQAKAMIKKGFCPDCGKMGEAKGHQDCQYPS